MRNTPSKEYRLSSAKKWIKTYSGKDLVKGYSKKYLVDKICAVKELRLIGVTISDDYEKKLRQSLETLRQQRLSVKLKKENELNALGEFESDENYAMIIGYTSGGCPYGVTHKEMSVGSEFE